MLPIRVILHPTDFSPHSEFAFTMACALARDYGARLVVAHVRPQTPAAFTEMGALVPVPIESKAELEEKLYAVKPPDASLSVGYRLLEGEPAEEIIALARETGADLVVMGTHGRTGIGRLLMGSVAELVLRRAPCPVLTLKTPFPLTEPVPEEKAELVGV